MSQTLLIALIRDASLLEVDPRVPGNCRRYCYLQAFRTRHIHALYLEHDMLPRLETLRFSRQHLDGDQDTADNTDHANLSGHH